MPRFDVYRNPNPRASHALFLDVQSDLVSTATRWCIPLLQARPGEPVVGRAQGLLSVAQVSYLMDTPNLLAVPAALLGSSRFQCNNWRYANPALARG